MDYPFCMYGETVEVYRYKIDYTEGEEAATEYAAYQDEAQAIATQHSGTVTPLDVSSYEWIDGMHFATRDEAKAFYDQGNDAYYASLRAAKETELSSACNSAITAGIDVETTQGTEHFALTETDQINLTTAYNAVLMGATGYPYHADGTMCRMFSADEIKAISEAGIAHIMYHTTLCNHLLTWARRAETIAEIEGISYTAEGMPEDLAANMASVLSSAQSV